MAAENDIKVLLETFFVKALESCSPKHRELIFAEVKINLECLDWTEILLKGLSKIILLISPHYNGKSRTVVKTFIHFVRNKCETSDLNFQEIFSAVGLKTVRAKNNFTVTSATSKSSLGLLNWTLLTGSKEWCPDFAELLSILANQIRGRRFENLVVKKLASHCSSMKPATFIALVDYASTDEKHLVILSYLAHCSKAVRFEDSSVETEMRTEKDYQETILKAKDIIMQKYLTSKESSDMWSLGKVSAELGQFLNFPDKVSMEHNFIAPLQKALLRSPETAISGATYLLENIGADLTEFGLTIAKMLSPHLRSQSEIIRLDAVKASVALVKKIKSLESIKLIMEWYLSVFHWSEGISAANKMCILKAIKDMKVCTMNINMEKDKSSNLTMESFSEWLVEQMIKIIGTEVHEGTIVEAFHDIYHWCEELSKVTVSPSIANYIRKGFEKDPISPIPLMSIDFSDFPSTSHKQDSTFKKITVSYNMTSLAKSSFYIALASYCKGRENHLDPFLPLICSTLTKLSTKANVTTLQEAIPLASIVAQSWLRSKLDVTITMDAWTSTCNVVDYVNENNITKLSSLVKLEIIRLAKNILINDSSKISDGICKAIVLVLASDNFQISKGISEFAVPSLVKFFPRIILVLEQAHSSNLVSSQTCEKILIEIAKTPMCHKWMPLAVLRIAHNCSDNLWERLINILHSLHQELSNHYRDIFMACWDIKNDVKPYILGFDNSLLSQRIVRTFSVFHGEEVVKCCLPELQKLKSNGSLFKVTKEEYFIFRTPEDQLFDVTVLQTDEIDSKNVKRESKVYSYEEQLEEIQLRKEIEKEKRQATGNSTHLHLSSKQKEAIKRQLNKESKIRNSMKELDRLVVKSIGLFDSIIEGDLQTLAHYLKDFINELIGLMDSYIGAPHAVRLFQKLASELFKKDSSFAYLMTQVSLALIAPKSEIGAGWNPSILKTALKNVLEKLKEKSANDKDFSCGCYTLCFPLLRLAVHKYPTEASIIAAVMDITLNQVKRTKTSRYIDDNPEFMPRIHINRLLYHAMDFCDNNIQHLAYRAITSLADSAIMDHAVVKHTIHIESSEYVVHLVSLSSHLKLVREAGLRSLIILPWEKARNLEGELLCRIRANIFRMRYDSDPYLSKIAQNYMEETRYEANVELFDELLICLMHAEEEVRVSGAFAVGDLVKMNPHTCEDIVEKLCKMYQNNLDKSPQIFDDFGKIVEDGIDKWEARSGAGLALKAISPYFAYYKAVHTLAKRTMVWIVTRALNDRNQTVHNIFLDTAIELVKGYGKVCLNDFESIIETYLDGACMSGDFDNLRQACVVLMGCLARYLDPNNGRVKYIVGKLLDALSTSSEKVQQEVAKCLPSLIPSIVDEKFDIVDRLIGKLMEGNKYGERRGAAYGLAGIVKGLGIMSLKEHYIMDRIVTGMLAKGNFEHRQGALMALELLSEYLGRLFEPYFITVLPYLMQCLGDPLQYVRDAAVITARRGMTRLSGHGVTLVLPSLLSALEDESWRRKCASVDLLGRMVHCAPGHLSDCLPMIVPKLIEALGDSHHKVQDSATEALKLIGSVIQNPEIQSIFPVVLKAN